MEQLTQQRQDAPEPDLVKMILGPWNTMARRPRHDGRYELRRRDGMGADLAVCRERSWATPVDGYDAWRGYVLPVMLESDSVQARTLRRVRQRLAEYRGGVAMTHAVAAKAALWLARLSVARTQGFAAYRYYLILAKLKSSALTETDAAWQAGFMQRHLDDPRLTKQQRAVDDFFARAGEPAAIEVTDLGPADIRVVEGIHGYYVYHIAWTSSPQAALCGAHTMITAVPVSTWGKVSHLGEQYCEACSTALAEIQKLGTAPAVA